MRSLALYCHESTPAPFVRSLQVQVDEDDGLLQLRYDLQGDVTHLRIPSPGPPARVHELWRHTCFEAFLKASDAGGYLELNFAPSGEWAAYEFSRYRTGMTPAVSIAPPVIVCTRSPSHLQVTASVTIPALRRHGTRVAISAVIEDDTGRVSYWALAHPRGKPDFHHDQGFVVAIEELAGGRGPHP